MKVNERKLYGAAYYQKDLNELRAFDFVIWTSCTDKKDLLDVAIRNWETYWCDHFGVFGNEWVLMDVWSASREGQYRELVARRVSRRCPPQFRALIDEQGMII